MLPKLTPAVLERIDELLVSDHRITPHCITAGSAAVGCVRGWLCGQGQYSTESRSLSLCIGNHPWCGGTESTYGALYL